ncbi:alpha-1,6-mannosylglycoprotein 6-beta-N-acetylglucosaminyltransferase A-like [Tubulanus polymorphus]|uniref:alpha-1,6-mannosylglycoprotein 6-beta-N-acetylglucosaminyltransferase A-like n=1 Tax=Tubulanus polymorphus TaxID=672921 RepID=UPI003DA4154E
MKVMLACFSIYILTLSFTAKIWSPRATNGLNATPQPPLRTTAETSTPVQTSKREPWNKCPDKTAPPSGNIPTLSELSSQMGDDWHWDWIKQRITSMWSEWLETATEMRNNHSKLAPPAKRILVIPGVVTLTNMAQPGVIRTGGPLGDLVQWADVIAALHALGHNVVLRHDFKKTSARLTLTQPGCQYGGFDLIYTDIIGAKQLSKSVFKKYKCRLRLLDAYGTEAMFNYPNPRHPAAMKYRSTYGGLGLHLKQFFTYFPHTPDNSFMGFVVPSRLKSHKYSKKENFALIYGKSLRYLEGKEKYIEAIQSILPVHATLSVKSLNNKKIINHGVVSHSEYHSLVKRAKICIGTGQPLESSGALEAIASGCVFLNPRLENGIKDSGKPTTREVNSQVPYLEDYVGPPHAYTINIVDTAAVTDLVRRIIYETAETKPFIPYEFTAYGFMERLHVYTTKQDFCKDRNSSTIWPPVSSMVLVVGATGASCNQACLKKDLVCEQVFFPFINNIHSMHRSNISCDSSAFKEDVIYPATVQGGKECSFQNERLLYSCSQGRYPYNRICPCRDFIKYQSALCTKCL